MVQSIDRAMSIISILVSEDGKPDWSISELSDATSLPLGTLHRILTSLISHGLVSQDPITKHYRVGYTWMEIGLRQLDKIDVRHAARTVMERLAYELEESIYLNIPKNTDGIPIEKVESPLKIRVLENLGDPIPLTIGAPNKTILANLSERERVRIVGQQIPAEQQEAFLQQLDDIRRNGYAVSFGERTEGTAAVGAPIIDRNQKVVAALSINAISFRVTEERLPMLIDKVKAAAEEISMKIGKT